MTLSNFASKLNWRLIVIHSTACWFLMDSFKLFSILHDLPMTDFFDYAFKVLKHSRGYSKISDYPDSSVFNSTRLFYFDLWIQMAKLAGLLICFIISLYITIKHHWFWINALIVFFIGVVFYKLNLPGVYYLWYILPGRVFKDDTIWYYIINGTVTLTVGFLLLFLKASVRFIEYKGNMKETGLPETEPV